MTVYADIQEYALLHPSGVILRNADASRLNAKRHHVESNRLTLQRKLSVPLRVLYKLKPTTPFSGTVNFSSWFVMLGEDPSPTTDDMLGY